MSDSILKYEDVVAWWQSKNLKTVADYESVLSNFQILFTCNTNRIEGDDLTYHTTREIFEDQPISQKGILPRVVFEVQNQKYAFKAILKCIVRHVPMSIAFIKKVHQKMMYGSYDNTRWEKGERPGQFKKGDYCVGFTDEGSSPECVEEDLLDLLEEIDAAEGKDVPTIVSYFHLQFESIHAFADGNGRVGRTLMNYYLMLHNYPPVVIHDEDRTVYYMALEVFDRTGEISGMIAFLKEQTVKTWEKHICKRSYTDKQITLARKLAPDMYKDLSNDELWERVGNYVSRL